MPPGMAAYVLVKARPALVTDVTLGVGALNRANERRGGRMGVLEAVGLGLIAGLIGTVALTLSEKAEMSVTGREPSTVPGQVGAKLIGRDPAQDPHLEGRNTAVHWAHGISMGAVRGLLALTGLAALPASLLFFVLLWSADVLLYRVLGIADFPWRWKPAELAADLFNKGVYAAVTSVAFVLLASAL